MSTHDTELEVRYEMLAENTGRVILKGSIDFSSSSDFQDQIKQILDKNPSHLLFDLWAVTYISSMGLSALVDLYKEAQARKIEVHLYDPQISVRRVMEISKLDFMLLNPEKLNSKSPFKAFVDQEEPGREKRRLVASQRKRPPRLYS